MELDMAKSEQEKYYERLNRKAEQDSKDARQAERDREWERNHPPKGDYWTENGGP
jgi:hypothetical protein